MARLAFFISGVNSGVKFLLDENLVVLTVWVMFTAVNHSGLPE